VQSGQAPANAGFIVDRPISRAEDDLFGFGPSVSVATRFLKECPRPILFAIYGRSGSGRTSFLNLLSAALGDQPEILQYHFSARPFRNSGCLSRALLRKIENALKIEQTDFELIKNTAAATPDPATRAFDHWIDATESMREDLQAHISGALDRLGRKCFMISIDDLDLCNAHDKIKLIEFVAEYLNIDRVVLVINVDRKQLISDYLGSNVFVAERQASLYLERIFPHSYSIPWIGEDQLIDHVIDALDRLDLLPFDRSKRNRPYARFRRMVEVYLRRAAVTPIKIVRELGKFARMHQLSVDAKVKVNHALFSIAIKSQFPEVYRFLLDKEDRGLRDLKKVFEPDQDFSAAGFTVRYGRRLDRMFADTALRDLFMAYDSSEVAWEELHSYLNTAAFVPSPY
jgi:hypothetical protein